MERLPYSLPAELEGSAAANIICFSTGLAQVKTSTTQALMCPDGLMPCSLRLFLIGLLGALPPAAGKLG
jgi:hypothetical protein